MMDVLRAHGIGKGLNAADKQALIDIVNRADANESVVRTSIVNALNAVSTDNELGLGASSTWADILAKIPQVKTGKKWATGTSTGSNGFVVVTGLSFRPRIILAQVYKAGATYYNFSHFVDASYGLNGVQVSEGYRDAYGANVSPQSPVSITPTGFSIWVNLVNPSAPAKWIAFE